MKTLKEVGEKQNGKQLGESGNHHKGGMNCHVTSKNGRKTLRTWMKSLVYKMACNSP